MKELKFKKMSISVKNGKLFVRTVNGITIYTFVVNHVPIYDFTKDIRLFLDDLKFRKFEDEGMESIELEWSNIACFDSNETSIAVVRNSQLKIFNFTTMESSVHFNEDSLIFDISIDANSRFIALFCDQVVNLWDIHKVQKIKQVIMSGIGSFTVDHLVLVPKVLWDRIYRFNVTDFSLETILFDKQISRVSTIQDLCIIQTETQIELWHPDRNETNIKFGSKLEELVKEIPSKLNLPLILSTVLTAPEVVFYFSNDLIFCIKHDTMLSYFRLDRSKVQIPDCKQDDKKQQEPKILGLFSILAKKINTLENNLELILSTRRDLLLEILNIWNANAKSKVYNDVTGRVRASFQYIIDYEIRIDVMVSFITILLKNSRVWLDIRVAKLGLQMISQLFLNAPEMDFKVYEMHYETTIFEFLSFLVDSLQDIVSKTIAFQNDPIMQLSLNSQERVELCNDIVNLTIEMNMKCIWMPTFEIQH